MLLEDGKTYKTAVNTLHTVTYLKDAVIYCFVDQDHKKYTKEGLWYEGRVNVDKDLIEEVIKIENIVPPAPTLVIEEPQMPMNINTDKVLANEVRELVNRLNNALSDCKIRDINVTLFIDEQCRVSVTQMVKSL